ncbi:putative reverse transcriptase domain-containing protein, partial [Tanacetum coccineum]
MEHGFISPKGGRGERRGGKHVVSKPATGIGVTSSTSGQNLGPSIDQTNKADNSNGTNIGNAYPNTSNIPINIYDSPTMDPNNYGPIISGPTSYARVTGEPSRKSVNFRTLITLTGNGGDLFVPLESIRAISERFVNTAYGFFLGKRVAYPVVANYNPYVNLMKEDVDNVLVWVKLHGVPVTAFSEDGLSVIATKLGTHLMFDSYTADMCIQ